jgi:enterochelin esterase-like enzyme
MLMKSLSLILSLAAAVLPLVAQETKPAAPRPPRPGPVVSPELAEGNSVTFRLKAPQAKEVKVQGQFGKETALTKEGDGLWQVTVEGVPPGVHEYRFVVDGLAVLDPQNAAVKPQRWPNTSILHVPSQPPAPWDLQDVAHGTLHSHDYKSKATGTWRRMVVYTPPGRAEGPLPVLYLSHGYSDNEGSWSVHGKAHWIMDALIAEKKAVPMIVVMPDAHALVPGAGGFDDYAKGNTTAFCTDLTGDVLPLIESTYRTVQSADGRAFAGLSMGGHHALTVALNHSDAFHWIGAFSSAPPAADLVAAGLGAPDKINGAHKLFWIGCGKGDFLFERNNQFTALLKEKGIRHEYAVTEGDHSWPVWRKYLIDLAPRLFR